MPALEILILGKCNFIITNMITPDKKGQMYGTDNGTKATKRLFIR